MRIRLWIGSLISIYGSIMFLYWHREVDFSRNKKTPRCAGRLDAEFFFLFFDSRLGFAARKIVFIHVRKDVGRKEWIGLLKKPVFFLSHMAVVRMALRYCPKLDLPKALSQIFALDKADAIRERDRVLCKVGIARRDFLRYVCRTFERLRKLVCESGFFELWRRVKTVGCGEKLVLLGEHAVPVQIAPRAYVHLDFKKGICVFKCARNPLPAFVPSLKICAENSFRSEHAVPVQIAPRAYVHLDFKKGICVFKCARNPLPAFVPSLKICAENSF